MLSEDAPPLTMGTWCCSAIGAARLAVASFDVPSNRVSWFCEISCSVTSAAIDGRLWSSAMSMFRRWPVPLTVIPPFALIQSWQNRLPSLAIWPLSAWLPVRERTAPTLIGLPNEWAIIPGRGPHAARSEKVSSSPATGSRSLRTMRDYVPKAERGRVKLVTNKLIAEPERRRAPSKLCDWLGRWRVSQVVRQRSAKPPPRVRIPHSPPVSEYDLTPASPF